ncbi:MAG: two-component system OmpR family alkaline phosphatase synthesis response regulator PhoP [Elusimicrobia bacterium]|nr:MAG: two-component system OmpR family alkaline phosphatase synthesis response regulator PhoP [Elusimicrobiota bacterium]KAF0154201.1 MAG: two-component system OmpR family alkaline phosphatase synthesis response regulator PhoP [Elusimicrobiota bacterium]
MRRHLEARGYAVSFTDNPSEGLILARDLKPAAVITDAEMPGMDGLTLCRAVKESAGRGGLPVILISGKMTEEDDILSAYGKGADDYLIKPFSMPIMLAKVSAVLRRYSAQAEAGERIKSEGIELNPEARTVSVKGSPVKLTRKEFDLLALLLTSPGRVLSPGHLLEKVWGYDPADYNDTHTVEVHISNLRKKLGPELSARIASVTGVGYKFD